MKPKVLIFCRTYEPGIKAGGPVKSLKGVTHSLSKLFDFYVVTLNVDAGESKPFPGITPHKWIKRRDEMVYYFAPKNVSLRNLRQLCQEIMPDVIYLNSLFDRVFTLRMLWLRFIKQICQCQFVLAVRGQLNEGALKINAFKKSIMLLLLVKIGLLRGLRWQATNPLEKKRINVCIFSKLRKKEDLDVVLAEPFNAPISSLKNKWEPRDQGSELRIVLVGRVSKMKNIRAAIRILRSMKEPSILNIFGPVEDALYYEDCLRDINAYGLNSSIIFHGLLHPEEVLENITKYDVFLLPTFGENYGHVIEEALASGLPVVISDRTPWGHVVDANVGWVFSLNNEKEFSTQLDLLATMEVNKMLLLRERASKYIQSLHDNANSVRQHQQLFQNATSSECG